MRITNNSKALQGVRVAGGGVRYIHPGKSVDADLDDAGLALAKRLPFLALGKDKTEAAPESNEIVALEAVHRGGGRYFVMDGESPTGEAMSKADAEAFNALSDEDKAALLKKD